MNYRNSVCTGAIVVLACLTLATTAAGQANEIWKINADGTGQTRVLDTKGWTCGSPEWSHDGKWIAYDTWRVGQKLEDSQIAIVRADGTDLRILGIGAMPSWSPDDKQLVFHTYGVAADGTRSGSDKLEVMNIDGTGRETVANHWGSPRWSTSGNRIVSILDDNIGVLDLATGVERKVLNHDVSMYWGINVSPNGQRFSFAGYQNGLYVADLNEQTQIATVREVAKQGTYRFPSFAPDNRRIVVSYSPNDTTPSQLYTMDVDATDPPQLLPGQDATHSNWGGDWSDDGKVIVFASRPPRAASKKPVDPTSDE